MRHRFYTCVGVGGGLAFQLCSGQLYVPGLRVVHTVKDPPFTVCRVQEVTYWANMEDRVCWIMTITYSKQACSNHGRLCSFICT